MYVTFYGTRGSVPVSRFDQTKYGGNTTCLRIESESVPEGCWLVVDAGSGIVPLGKEFMMNSGKQVMMLQTHWHHDHTQGMPLSVFPYVKHVPVSIYGPKERGIGGRQVYKTVMKPPYFPVDFAEIGSHLKFYDIEHPNAVVLVIHREGGMRTFKVEEFERLENAGKQLPFQKQKKFHASECLVVRMHRTTHPEQTISFRFEERSTGQVFVFVTDHENQDGIPQSFRAHLKGTNLLVMDTQYTRKKYDLMAAGYGHATPDYVAFVAREVGAKFLGTTHHDPDSTDSTVDEIVRTAQEVAGPDIRVFGCRDYLRVDVGNVEETIKDKSK